MERRLILMLISCVFAPASSVTGAEFVEIGEVFPWSISADGRVIGGYTRDQDLGFIWSREQGLRILATLPGHVISSVQDMSADGSVVVGWSSTTQGTGGAQPFLWTEAGGMVRLGHLPGFKATERYLSISDDASTVVGTMANYSSGLPTELSAFRWTDEAGLESLHPAGAIGSRAFDVSADGSVIIGDKILAGDAEQGFVWDENNGFQDLGPKPPGWDQLNSWLVSADGSIVFGKDMNKYYSPGRPFRWKEAEGVEELPLPDGWEAPGLNDISPDGSILVGAARPQQFAVLWDQRNGFRDLREVLIADHGFAAQELPYLRSAMGISDDAMTIVGNGPLGGAAWAIYLDKPLVSFGLEGDYNNNGTVEQADLDLVLLHWGANASAVPDTWTNDLPTGAIDQAEFDGVLLNWGHTSTAIVTAGVPEPSTVAVMLIATVAVLLGHHCSLLRGAMFTNQNKK